MDFGALPPEINSARIYAGPGSAPLRAAATAWQELADELSAAAHGYHAVTAGLASGPWRGPSSTSMSAAAGRFVDWLADLAVAAEQTSARAHAGAAAYDAVFLATVPPPVVAANRALLASLVATDFLGQNMPAIAAAESHYAQMWAQDAAAMYSYAAESASAAALTPFATPPAASGLIGDLTAPLSLLAPLETGLSSSELATASGAWASASDADSAIMASHTEIAGTHDLITNSLGQFDGLETRIMNRLDRLGGASPVAASTGQARSVGALSVPRGWAVAYRPARPTALAFTMTGLVAAPEFASTTANPIADLAVTSAAGRAFGISAGARRPEPGSPMRPATGSPFATATTASELCKLAELRDRGILTDDEFTEQKRRLLA